MVKVDAKIFSAAKILLENGATIAETARFMKLSEPTIKMIKRSETFEEYKNNIAVKCLQNKEKKAEAPKQPEQKQTVIVQATWQMTQEMQKTNELLAAISNKLAFIVEELCGTTTKEA